MVSEMCWNDWQGYTVRLCGRFGEACLRWIGNGNIKAHLSGWSGMIEEANYALQESFVKQVNMALFSDVILGSVSKLPRSLPASGIARQMLYVKMKDCISCFF